METSSKSLSEFYSFKVSEVAPPETSKLILGPSNPDGPIWGCTKRHLTRDGAPFMPAMGEFHFSRYPAEEWESSILKMKAGGIDIVSTYLFWIHHEEERGVFDFSGQRDIRRFIELCDKHGLYVWLRPGPWCHGEVRNGGFPDWIKDCIDVEPNSMMGWGNDLLRSNDPTYLELVDTLFAKYFEQCQGLFAKDGGPVIGVQAENEYSKKGEGMGEVHIAKLIEMLKAHGFLAPFYSVTGWHNAPFPDFQCLPMFGGYPAAPWVAHTNKLEPQQIYRFDLQRDAGGIGTDLLKPNVDSQRDLSHYPLMTCEIGVGNQPSYHRRPLIDALDGFAPVFTRLGIGAGCIGYFMYHGGTNPEGKFSTLNESKATGYPNDYSVKSYDFQAAIRESGRIDPKSHYLRKLHHLMHDYGQALAPTIAMLPDRSPEDDADFATAKMALRTDGKQGFLFVNNHVRGYPQPAHENVQIRVDLNGREIVLPKEPVTIPPSAMFVWPVAMPLADATLLSSTAEPICTLNDDAGKVYVFAQTVTERSEFVFDADSLQGDESTFSVEPGFDSLLEVTSQSGGKIRILTLTAEQALQAYKHTIGASEHLFISDADLLFDGAQITALTSAETPVHLSTFPAVQLEGAQQTEEAASGGFAVYSLTAPSIEVQQPTIQSSGSNEWNIHTGELPQVSRLCIDFTGDVAELYLGDQLIYDYYYNGEPFEVSLDRYADQLAEQPLKLKISPLDESKDIYLDVPRPESTPNLKHVQLTVEKATTLSIKAQ